MLMKKKGKTLYYEDTAKLLTQLKHSEPYLWLNCTCIDFMQQSLRDLQRTYNDFLLKRCNCPKPRKKAAKQSFRMTTVWFQGSSLRIYKVGYVKIKLHKDLSSYKCKSATIIKKPSGKYFASILCEKEMEEPTKQLSEENSIGLDYSSAEFYIDNEGRSARYSHYYYQSQVKLAKEQRKLSKMQKGSHNYEKQRIRVAKIHEKIYNQRHNFQHNLSHKLATNYDYICIEDLDLKNIIKNQDIHLGKSTTDNSYYTFAQLLLYKLDEQGKKLIKVDRYFPSSQLCSCCNYRNYELREKYLVEWTCPQCKTTHNRDVNAARNILKEGLRLALS